MARARSRTTSDEATESTAAAPVVVRPRAAGVARRKPAEDAGRAPRARAEAAGGAGPLAQTVWIGAIAGALFSGVALASWHATDRSFSVVSSAPVRNAGGPVGAHLADALYQGFGHAAWMVPGLGVAAALRLAGRPASSLGTRLLGLAGWLLGCATLEHAIHRVGAPYPPGGVLGQVLDRWIVSGLGTTGGAILLGASLLGVATLLFRINWQPLAAKAVDGVRAGAPAAARSLGSTGATAFRAGAAGLGSLREQFRAPPPATTDDDGEDDPAADEGWDDADAAEQADAGPLMPAPEVAPAAKPAPRPAVPAAAPAETAGAPVRREPEVVPVRMPIGDPEPRPMARPIVDRDAPTHVAQRTLVEVELERSTSTSAGRPPAVPVAAPAASPAAPPVTASAPPPAARGGERLTLAPGERRRAGEADPVDGYGAAADAHVRADSERGTTAVRRTADLAVPGFDAPAPRTPAPAAIPPERTTEPGEPAGALDDDDEDDLFEEDDDPDEETGDATSSAAGSAGPAGGVAGGAAPRPTREVEPAPRVLPGVELEVDDAPVRPARARRANASDVAVLPGNLQSGGSRDDGSAVRQARAFKLPPLSLLDDHPPVIAGTDEGALQDTARRLLQTLKEFRIEGRISAIRPGPVITMYEFEPAPGVKLATIVGLQDNIKMALRAVSVRIVAPLPGRGCVGIEVPNETRQTIWSRDVFASPEFAKAERVLPMILGKDTEGRPFVTDLARMPHLLIGGTTGSGKSVGVNAMLCSMLYVRPPEELRMILIDPKMLEFALYEDIPHLLHPVVTDPKFASAVLKWACDEMDDRYKLMARWQTRNIENYNAKVEQELKDWTPEKARRYAPPDWPEGDLLPQPRKLPFIVIVIDELADLMLVASSDVETSISRIVAKARAAGIHLIVATQTPRRDVITGTIKANMPSSLSYQVRSGLDSRVILDEMGAETLLGRGDLLFRPPGTGVPMRIHGPFLSEGEVQRIADFLRAQGRPEYDDRIASAAKTTGGDAEIEYDEKYDEAVQFAIERGSISTSMLQRHLGIGYNRAANIVDVMEQEGVVGPADGVKPRKVLVGGHG
ncbi:MAG: hypothetical protein RLZZ299_1169 [Pseudomonadota bacterium]